MKSAEIRKSFLDFFASKGHQIVPSASLMPSSPNLLFTNAGMNPFVPYFLGERQAPFSRAVDTQKCIRAGGKHNDLEDVGFDTYHHTFFEMLGNWSFGDYFKKEAIEWAWELLTVVWKIPKERLYASVYKPGEGDPAAFDQEAYDYWKALFEKEGLDPEVHIVYGNKADNFWMMGDTGPCGPCSEIHIDLTEAGDSQGKLVNADSPYCIEIWNLVFIQFNAEPGGAFKPLTAKHVDTGMGFERVAGIMATTEGFTDFTQPPSNYNSDLFTHIFNKITELSGKKYDYTMPSDPHSLSEIELKDVVFRVLADHARTVCCSIADNIIPSNEGRNYVIRRILRRAVLYGQKLNLPSGFFVQLIEPVVNELGDVFPELKKQQAIIKKVIASEEKSFEQTLEKGLREIDKIEARGTGAISGKDAFYLKDTLGFPFELTQLEAAARNLKLDEAAYNKHLDEAKKRSQDSQATTVIKVADSDDSSEATDFTGFYHANLSQYTTKVITTVTNAEKATFIILESSPFYAEMGGQIGDSGQLTTESGETVAVIDTQKDDHGRFLHQVKGSPLAIKAGDTVTLSVDVERRQAIQRHHSATHLLNFSLRTVLGTHVLQAGSLVDAEHLRFDFNHFEALTPEQISEIEAIVNQRILDNAAVNWKAIPFEQKPEDCIATFGEKYGDVVRVVDIGGYSKELCGGTHVSNTGEIGLFKIISESAVAAGTRRIEAVVGNSAYHLAKENFSQLQTLAHTLSCKPHQIENRLSQLLEQRSVLEKKLKGFERKGAAEKADSLLASAKDKDGTPIIAKAVEVSHPKELQSLAVQTSKQLGEGVVILGAALGDKVTVVALCSPQAIAAGQHAGNWIKQITAQLGGKGGGKPDFAMGGGKDVSKLKDVLAQIA